MDELRLSDRISTNEKHSCWLKLPKIKSNIKSSSSRWADFLNVCLFSFFLPNRQFFCLKIQESLTIRRSNVRLKPGVK